MNSFNFLWTSISFSSKFLWFLFFLYVHFLDFLLFSKDINLLINAYYKTTDHQQANDHRPLTTNCLSTDWSTTKHQAPTHWLLHDRPTNHWPLTHGPINHRPTTHPSPTYRLSERLSGSMNYFIIYMTTWWYRFLYGIPGLEFKLAIITYI